MQYIMLDIHFSIATCLLCVYSSFMNVIFFPYLVVGFSSNTRKRCIWFIICTIPFPILTWYKSRERTLTLRNPSHHHQYRRNPSRPLKWQLTNLLADEKIVGCKRVFTVKCNANSSIERYKVKLVARGITQTYKMNYQKTFEILH